MLFMGVKLLMKSESDDGAFRGRRFAAAESKGRRRKAARGGELFSGGGCSVRGDNFSDRVVIGQCTV